MKLEDTSSAEPINIENGALVVEGFNKDKFYEQKLKN
jgi:hypothetical protein